ncbi:MULTISPECIES: hypothetical protein [unclassified Burkholderia]|uniref:hypothetical protein n=1 Tax=unclassified Burkholderia TaxID=2613784 RepID=UPI00142285AF|nr:MULTISPECIES: hypothetical protein [unclassified Burkholderia]NIE83761.1 hypothetical protein [Burkholderia sp. Tr-860]NIF62431.1 hypothetical protein [Burkholderia sp. Cy-647]NIF94329.1 hypothetical protein [Burkholderia sp. Ax-1720]
MPIPTHTGGAVDDRRYFVLRSFPPNEQARRYEARVAAGSNTPATAIRETEFFVLDLTSDPHAPAAMIAYARACASTRPELAADMLKRFDAGDSAEAVALQGEPDSSGSALALSALRVIVADDARAATYQSISQYRAALLAAIDDSYTSSMADTSQEFRIHERRRIDGAIRALRAALAAFPKTVSEVCLEEALGILQGRDMTGGFVAFEGAGQSENAAVSPATASGLPAWFDTFLTNVCEIPDRSSPEGEPDAIIATLEELKNCALNAIEECAGDEPATADERAAFEQNNPGNIKRDPDGDYENPYVESAWTGFKWGCAHVRTSQAAALSQCAQGENEGE